MPHLVGQQVDDDRLRTPRVHGQDRLRDRAYGPEPLGDRAPVSRAFASKLRLRRMRATERQEHAEGWCDFSQTIPAEPIPKGHNPIHFVGV
ncbi:hypothetical protein BIV25_37230 [Streptomyces sp. MUSC 14]|nr:hypothetical protein BIV25_37230 [Streptomyces sp. MUSC 14]